MVYNIGKKRRRFPRQPFEEVCTSPMPPSSQKQLSTLNNLERDRRGFCVAKSQLLSQSLLWTLQRDYFTQRGLNAWSQGEVPHYITSNPTIAIAYAEIVFAHWQDRAQHLTSAQPLYLCELGAGSGRFAFHFLTHLTQLCEQSHLPLTNFRYILTDFAQANLDAWNRHPQFRPFFQRGILDIARFDISRDNQLSLQHSGEILTPQTLERPLVVVANYLFDSIPQDLYYIDNGQVHTCLVSLFCQQDPKTLDSAELLEHIELHYDYQPTNFTDLDPHLQALLRHYQQRLTDTHLLVPSTGLLCLKRLQALSQQGLLLLSADKGKLDLSQLQGNRPPRLVTHHGCFSLSVNYGLFQTWCELQGGIALTPNTAHQSLCVIALIMSQHPERYRQTQWAYDRYVQTFGPDDFFRITKHLRQTLDQTSVADILAYLRLSHYDSHQFNRYLPRLQQLASDVSSQEHTAVLSAIDQVWQRYFPIGEDNDFAFKLASFCFQLQEYKRALNYFEQSIQIHGQQINTLFNMALCCQQLGHSHRANILLKQVLNLDPDHKQARDLLVRGNTESRPSRALIAV
ncbi:MAG: tetratricopeptide repeat protein [Pleurocapsa sp. MO_226.B13]|nr:tetratricopeptide repeat protein [Pleurocapsa sp. MO_226.B13]